MSAEQSTPSIFDDKTFKQNHRCFDPTDTRIIGGVPTTEFPECVAVGGLDRYCCTGTLIAQQAVLTAGHCAAHGCRERIFIGNNVEQQGTEIRVQDAIMQPDYVPNSRVQPFDDIAVLILVEPVQTVEPVQICSLDAIAAARSVRLVGFGNTDPGSTTGYGIKRMVDVGVASENAGFGARFETEFVAGAPNLDHDTCNGDSGGPAYVLVDGRFELAGATSRGTRGAQRNCGDGGVYTRVPAYRNWLVATVGPLG
ncbi:S1 family peptidase [Candidatus Mycolicibacterium alkanivorans]|uniref:Trypsin-like serine protease n=1 Tax=Candidatus Mycolicibacterium alkanivorans TaxID=2954114 RepID=A0ABS9YTE6_9MYCO|nr:trypsin-like serine protease [Candidatus Mycolicibacterium alkanivorans]MCI4674167.1 trypsin-like serine protease [Candidatus Mycolicibacterium alkanivorans]